MIPLGPLCSAEPVRAKATGAHAPRHAVALGSLAELGRKVLYGGGVAGAGQLS